MDFFEITAAIAIILCLIFIASASFAMIMLCVSLLGA